MNLDLKYLLPLNILLLCAVALTQNSCFVSTQNSFVGDEGLTTGAAHLSAMSSNRCFSCHAAWGNYQTDQEWVDGLAGEIVPGDAANSDFYKRVIGASGVNVMPPSGEIMSDSEAEAIANWINEMALR